MEDRRTLDGANRELAKALSTLEVTKDELARATFKAIRAEEALFAASERLRAVAASVAEAVLVVDAEEKVTFLNPAAERLTGWRADEAIGLPVAMVFRAQAERTGLDASHALQQCKRSRTIVSLSGTLLKRRSGLELPIACSVAPVFDMRGMAAGVTIVFSDASAQKPPLQPAGGTGEAARDSLTGLVDRAEFGRRAQLMLEHAKERKQIHALLYIDLDRFKLVNDTCGHAAGDELLRQLTAMLKSQTRERDTLARLGGDEFAMLLGDCPLSQALLIADQLRKAVFQFKFQWEKRSFSIGASIGIAQITEQSTDVSTLLNSADAACMSAKVAGGNGVEVCPLNSEESERERAHMQWAPRLRAALEMNRFHLYWQPIVKIADGNNGEVGLDGEVLLRLRENNRVLTAASFLPSAERYRQIATIDRWVIHNTLATMRAPSIPARLSLNVSGQSVSNPEFPRYVAKEIAESGVDPHRICLEITETAAIANLEAATRLMMELRKNGCRFALDDVGSGLSSFPYLKNLPIDYLKIGYELVNDISREPLHFAMVDAIHRIGRVLGIKTVAKGVENQATLKKLKGIGVNFAQGWAIAKPAPFAVWGPERP